MPHEPWLSSVSPLSSARRRGLNRFGSDAEVTARLIESGPTDSAQAPRSPSQERMFQVLGQVTNIASRERVGLTSSPDEEAFAAAEVSSPDYSPSSSPSSTSTPEKGAGATKTAPAAPVTAPPQWPGERAPNSSHDVCFLREWCEDERCPRCNTTWSEEDVAGGKIQLHARLDLETQKFHLLTPSPCQTRESGAGDGAVDLRVLSPLERRFGLRIVNLSVTIPTNMQKSRQRG